MSRIFEVLERLQEQEIFQAPPFKKQTLGKFDVSDSPASVPDLDVAASEGEILTLVQRLFLASDGEGRPGLRRVVFCGIDEACASQSLCSRVSLILARQVESQICLVDANPQRNNTIYLPSSCEIQPEATPRFTRRVTRNLCVLSGESTSMSGASGSLNSLKTLMSDLNEEFRYWVISAAPIGLNSDAAVLGQIADGVVLVLEANSTRRAAALRAKQSLEDAHVRVLGVVLNSCTFPIPEAIYRRL